MNLKVVKDHLSIQQGNWRGTLAHAEVSLTSSAFNYTIFAWPLMKKTVHDEGMFKVKWARVHGRIMLSLTVVPLIFLSLLLASVLQRQT